MWKAVWNTVWKPVNFHTIFIWVSQHFTHISHASFTCMWNINMWRTYEECVKTMWTTCDKCYPFHTLFHMQVHILFHTFFKALFFFTRFFHTVFHMINHVKFPHYNNLNIIFHMHFTYHFTRHGISFHTFYLSPHAFRKSEKNWEFRIIRRPDIILMKCLSLE